jgi:WD40 repeat protein
MDNKLQILDGKTHQIIRSLQPVNFAVNSVAWSSDGSQLTGVDERGFVRCWQVEDGRLLWEIRVSAEALLKVAWRSDNHRLAVAGYDNTIYLLDPANGAIKDRIRLGEPVVPGLTDAILWVDWSPDGTKLASGGKDKLIRIWDARNLTLLQAIRVLEQDAAFGRWSPDSKLIATNSDTNSIQVWNAVTGERVNELSDPKVSIILMTWSPDGQYIAITSRDQHVYVWNRTTRELFQVDEGPADDFETPIHLDWSIQNTIVYGSYTDVRKFDPGHVLLTFFDFAPS